MNILSSKSINLTPLERARLKLITMFGLIAAFNAVLAILAYFTQFKVLNWHSFLGIVLSQVGLAVLEALRKYFTAHGDAPLAATTQLVENEVQVHAPAIQYTDNQKAIQAAVSALMTSPQQTNITTSTKPDQVL